MDGYSNQPIPKEAVKQLLALDLQDKEILSYIKFISTVFGYGIVKFIVSPEFCGAGLHVDHKSFMHSHCRLPDVNFIVYRVFDDVNRTCTHIITSITLYTKHAKNASSV